MNKRIKGIVLGCSLLAVLGGALAFLLLTDKPEENSSSEDEHTHAKLLWDIENSDDIAKITVSKPDGTSFTATRKKEKTMTTDYQTQQNYETEVVNYYISGLENLPMDTTGVRLLASRSNSISAGAVVQENPTDEDLKKYGLDKTVKVTFEVDNADNVSFEIGNRTPVADYTYLRCGDDPTVYTVQTFAMEPFLKKPEEFLGTKLTQELASDDNTMVQSVRVHRKDLPYDISLEYDPYYVEENNGGMSALHVMKEPIYCLLNVDKSEKITHGLYGLSAQQVVKPHPTAEDLTQYGFDDPFTTVDVRIDNGKTMHFELGNSYEVENTDASGKKTSVKYYYGKLDGTDCIYGFSADEISYDDVQAADITAKTVIDIFVWDIGSLVYEAGDLKLAFEGKGTDKEDFVLKLNGEDTDLERYRLLYTYLLKAAAEDLVLEEIHPDTDPLVKVTVKRQDGKRDQELAFYDAGDMKAYIMINGQIRYRCRMSYVKTLIENLKIYNDTDKAFTMTW